MHNAAAYCDADASSSEFEADMLAAVPANVLNIQELYAAAGADASRLVNSVDHRQSTPLHSAAGGWPVAVGALLQLGAVVDLGDASEFTALHVACSHSCVMSVELLLAAGANVHARSKMRPSHGEGQWLPLHHAVTSRWFRSRGSKSVLQMVSLLLAHGASINDLTTRGCSALWLLARTVGQADAPVRVRKLVELGAAVDFYSEVHGSLLHAVAAGGNSQVLKELLSCGVSLDDSKHNARLKTPLHIAAAAGHAAMVLQLLQLGADVSAVDRSGNTALRLCMQG
eukprot:9103-Heterococcus_DN1.PRE.1